RVKPGAMVKLDAAPSTDPDGQSLRYEWIYYPEPGSYRGPAPEIRGAASSTATLIAPASASPATLHFVLAVTDTGSPALTRYARVILELTP
ncbi:MAG: PKD domain-containing protein, partial [Actinomycetota bacterium]